MQLHLDLKIRRSEHLIDHRQALLLMGSCFSEHIGQKLKSLKFKADTNPFGIVFNPRSMAISLQRITEEKAYTANDLIQHNNLWHGLDAHGRFSDTGQAKVLQQLNQSLHSWHEQLKTARWLMLTFGSAYVYRHLATGRYVANCHRIPQQDFSKELLDKESIVSELSAVLEHLKVINPRCRVLLTVSPVKHLRDGVVENNLSKAILLQSVHALVALHPQCAYFPAYELVTDDLRDYRFFEADMAHPNQQAIGYVWSKFANAYFSDDTLALNQKLEELNKARQHRFLHAEPQAIKAFKESYALKAKALKEQYPFIDLEEGVEI